MIEVRPGARSDAPVIAEFQVRLAEETEGFALDPETLRKGVAAVFDDPSRGSYLIAEMGGAPVGCLLTVPEWSDWRNGTVLWIHSVYVTPGARRRGVFRSLYAHLKARVERDGALKGLRLYVHKENDAARCVYESLGMDGERYGMFEWMPGG